MVHKTHNITAYISFWVWGYHSQCIKVHVQIYGGLGTVSSQIVMISVMMRVGQFSTWLSKSLCWPCIVMALYNRFGKNRKYDGSRSTLYKFCFLLTLLQLSIERRCCVCENTTSYLKNHWTKHSLVCIHFYPFPMPIQNMATKLENV